MEKFIEKLAKTQVAKDAKNPWDFSCEGNAIRRKNLKGYFAKMSQLKPVVLLVGEAPGYRGCGRAGIPFCSEKLIFSNSFFADKTAFGIENVKTPIAEASASIVWKTFDNFGFYPVMWATYPFHPHKPDNEFSNRAPRPDEVAIGKEFLKEIIQQFNITKIIAVGRVAEKCLTEMGYGVYAVRHPSHGGAKLFTKGIADFLAAQRKPRGLAPAMDSVAPAGR